MVITIEKLLSQTDGKVEIWVDDEKKWTARTQVPGVWLRRGGAVPIPDGSQAVINITAIDEGTITIR